MPLNRFKPMATGSEPAGAQAFIDVIKALWTKRRLSILLQNKMRGLVLAPWPKRVVALNAWFESSTQPRHQHTQLRSNQW